jgi:molybdopterin molybdotransferase
METISCDSPVLGVDLMPVDEALQRLKKQANQLKGTELVPLRDCLGRVLAKPITSGVNVPQHANSSMDGYAICCSDWHGSLDEKYPVSQRIPAGAVGSKLNSKTAARIFTGAPIPEGADAVVMQELCSTEMEVGGEYLKIEQLPVLGQNIRCAGEDISQGSSILSDGHQLRAQDVGLLASIGVTDVEVIERLKVAVFFTGDEIIEPGKQLQPGQIYNSNRYTLTAMLKAWGCDVIDLGNVEDSLVETVKAFEEASGVADLIITSGGVSVGEEDHIRPALESLGDLDIWRISIKPGKPLAFGNVKQIPFIGLPGNPVSVFATCCVLARPFIKSMQGMSFESVEGVPVSVGFDLPYKARRREYLRVRLEYSEDHRQVLTLFGNQSSGVLTSASWADGFALIEIGRKLEKGDTVEFIPFSFYGL